MADEVQGGSDTIEQTNNRQVADIEIVDSDTGEPLSVDLNDHTGTPRETGSQPKTPQQPIPTQDGKQPPKAPEIPQGFGKDFYGQDGSFDVKKALDFNKKFKPFEFKGISPTPNQAPAAPMMQAAQPSAAPPAPEKSEIQKYRDELNASYLSPIETIYSDLRKANALTPEMNDYLQATYAQKKREVEDKIFDRMEQLRKTERDELQKTFESKSKRSEIQSKSEATIYRVAMETGGFDQFNAMMFGNTAPDPKDPSKQQTIRGPGADVIDFAFKQAHAGKQLSGDEFSKAYTDFWLDFSADEENVRMAHELARGRWVLHNLDRIREGMRREILAEEEAKRKPGPRAPSSRQFTSGSRPVDPLEGFLSPVGRDQV